ncbi:MAG: Mut7-C RNAse domain-containing protein [Anaerolineae bacterium]|nr:Mut7-C RNAse domain-containing protein [Anaerolineae bacterium]
MNQLVTSQAPKLLADAMLGKLARWLRVLGYDVVYIAKGPDTLIAARARAEERILLTRDRELANRRGLQVVFIESEELETQLAQTIQEIPPLLPDIPPRCMHCNAVLEDISVEEAAQHVPPYVKDTQNQFRRCPECGRVYWPGTHWQAMEEKVQEVLANNKEISGD